MCFPQEDGAKKKRNILEKKTEWSRLGVEFMDRNHSPLASGIAYARDINFDSLQVGSKRRIQEKPCGLLRRCALELSTAGLRYRVSSNWVSQLKTSISKKNQRNSDVMVVLVGLNHKLVTSALFMLPATLSLLILP